MAPPTISTVSPATGPAAGGQLVTITGTNFKTPTLRYDVPQDDVVMTPTVSVTIGGRAVRRVDVLSSTEVRVLTNRFWHTDPRKDAFDAVDIVLTNLADDGVTPLAGQSIVKSAAYTYTRWDLGAPRQDSPPARILKETMLALAIEVERNTYAVTHVDYGEEGTAVIVDEASLPSLNVTVSVERDLEFSQFDNTPEEIQQQDGSWKSYEGARTMMLILDILAAGEGVNEALHICQAVQDFVQIHPMLIAAADPTLYPGEEDEYPIEIWQDPRQVGAPGESGMVVFSMQLRVRGIRTLPDEATVHGETVGTVTVTEQHLDSDGEDDGEPTHTDLVTP